MSLADRLRHTVEIQRYAPALDEEDQSIEDGWGQSTASWSPLATVPGWLQVEARAEQPAGSDVGAVATTATVFLVPTDVTEGDRLVIDGKLYQVDAVVDAGSKGHHLELTVHGLGLPAPAEEE